MKRRTFVISVGSIAAAAGTALGSGAFDQIDADREASIAVADDANALIELADNGGSQFVTTDASGLLKLEYAGSGNASGANDSAVTTIEAGFKVGNNSTQGVGVKIEDDATVDAAVTLSAASDGSDVEQYPGANGDPHNLDAYDQTNTVQDSFDVTIKLDTREADLSGFSTITVTADPNAYVA